MILAVPEQNAAVVQRHGEADRRIVFTWFRWWCSECRVASSGRSSHADLALALGDAHQAMTACHVAGQLELFPSPTRS